MIPIPQQPLAIPYPMSNIPSNEQIRTALDNAYAYAKTVQGGKNASYIPALAQVPSDLLAIAVVTVNGDLLTAGSADAPFAIESISKAFNLAYVMDLIGMKQLRAKIGADPTGEPFNSVMAIELHGGKPLNPLVNAGAMATVSLVNGQHSAGAQQHIGQFFVNLLDALFSTCGAEGDLSSRQAAIHQSLAQRNSLVHAVESDNGDDTNFVNALKDRIHNAFSLH